MNNDGEQFELDPEDIILLLLDAHERINKSLYLNGITRLEKLVFLLERETPFSGVGDLFKFTAYNFGPFSKEVYESIDFLESCNLISVTEKSHTSIYARAAEEKLSSEIPVSDDESDPSASSVREKIFQLTENGRDVACKLRQAISDEDIQSINLVISKYARLSLGQIIRYVYHQFKDMTINSIHPEAKRVTR